MKISLWPSPAPTPLRYSTCTRARAASPWVQTPIWFSGTLMSWRLSQRRATIWWVRVQDSLLFRWCTSRGVVYHWAKLCSCEGGLQSWPENSGYSDRILGVGYVTLASDIILSSVMDVSLLLWRRNCTQRHEDLF